MFPTWSNIPQQCPNEPNVPKIPIYQVEQAMINGEILILPFGIKVTFLVLDRLWAFRVSGGCKLTHTQELPCFETELIVWGFSQKTSFAERVGEGSAKM